MKDSDQASGTRPYRMKIRGEAVAENREQILRAMIDLWLERHYDDVTLSDVADAAGVSRQTVYRQFGSKDELLVAAADWATPQSDAARAAEPGDVDTAIRHLVDAYEVMGDANVRALELEGRVPAIDHMMKLGRTHHSGWIVDVFGPLLPPARDRKREPAVLSLYAATDVMVWKLLRRDFKCSRPRTEQIMRTLVDGVVHELAGNS